MFRTASALCEMATSSKVMKRKHYLRFFYRIFTGRDDELTDHQVASQMGIAIHCSPTFEGCLKLW
jgi:hypothetical protein